MNKVSAGLGTILLLVACFLFLVVFSNGDLGNFVITGTNAMANFAAFLYVIIALPIGAGLAFYGYAVRKPIFATSGPQTVYLVRSSLATVALVLAIIAILIGLGAVYYASTVTPSNGSSSNLSNLQNQVNSMATQVTSLQTKVSSLNGSSSSLGSVNVAPTTIPFRVDWCNTDNTGEDRYCPQNLVVDQGDTVQILFMHNDSDAHTFTILPAASTPGPNSGYSFQINLTYGAPGYTTYDSTAPNGAGAYANGMHNFLTNGNFSASCTNTADYTAISASACVSGFSLNSPASYNMAINPDPAVPFSGGTGPILINVTNNAFFPYINISAAEAGLTTATGTGTGMESWGIGAFNATQPGIYEYFCHYHVSNGMFGYLIVLPNAYCNKNPTTCGITSS